MFDTTWSAIFAHPVKKQTLTMHKPASVLILLSSILFSHISLAQVVNPNVQPKIRKQTNWQQEVDHTIKVKVEAETHILECEETIQYTNNSPNKLTEIWFHIWPNAFSDNKTGFGKEALITGNARYLYAPDKDRGGVSNLKFTVNDKPASFEYHEKYVDIIKLNLPFELLPGQIITIKTPFTVKLPHHFSRMGVQGKMISATQWYPKPAVYDANGWNIFPYQDQGEYFSEYGSYHVSITLPSNYKVAATGALQESEEWAWMTSLNRRTNKADSIKDDRDPKTNKTLTFVQKNVPDFAWFASPLFEVYMDSVALKKDKIVRTLAMYETKAPTNVKGIVLGGRPTAFQPDKGKEMLELIEKALSYYSKRVGMYPYDYCSVVIGGLPSAGGMEYPMVTICAGKDAIVHEVGHNWFQNILGSNERAFPWMDESLNTFYHNQAEESLKEWLPGTSASPSSMISQWHLTTDFGICQPGNIHSNNYNGLSYGTVVYAGNPIHFAYLQEFLGRSLMDSCMKAYFEKWKFRHPLPQDIKDVFEEVSKKDLSWFFNGLLDGHIPDYRISKIKKNKESITVGIKNQRSLNVPLKLSYLNGKKSQHVWLQGQDTVVTLKDKSIKHVAINPTGFLLERNLANDEANTSGILRKWGKTDLKYFMYKRGQNNIWIIPNVFTSNNLDGYTPGLVISNFSVPRRNYEWVLAPSYGFRSGTPVGLANIQRNIWMDKGPFSMLQAGVYYQRYSLQTVADEGSTGNTPYNHFSPFVKAFVKRDKRALSSYFTLAADINRLDNSGFAAIGKGSSGLDSSYTAMHPSDYQNQFLRLSYNRKVMKKINPAELKALFEVGGNKDKNGMHFAKLTVSQDVFVPYFGLFTTENLQKSKKGKFGAYLKIYGAAFLWKENENNTQGFYNIAINGAQGNYDYAFRDLMKYRSNLAPNAAKGLALSNQQLLSSSNSIRMFQFVSDSATGISSANYATNNWCVGTQIQTSILPILPNLQWFFDGALNVQPLTTGSSGGPTTTVNKAYFYWASGLTYRLHSGGYTSFELNVPLLYSTDFKSNVESNGIRTKQLISFRVNWNLFSIDKIHELTAF